MITTPRRGSRSFLRRDVSTLRNPLPAFPVEGREVSASSAGANRPVGMTISATWALCGATQLQLINPMRYTIEGDVAERNVTAPSGRPFTSFVVVRRGTKPLRRKGFGLVRSGANRTWVGWQCGVCRSRASVLVAGIRSRSWVCTAGPPVRWRMPPGSACGC